MCRVWPVAVLRCKVSVRSRRVSGERLEIRGHNSITNMNTRSKLDTDGALTTAGLLSGGWRVVRGVVRRARSVRRAAHGDVVVREGLPRPRSWRLVSPA